MYKTPNKTLSCLVLSICAAMKWGGALRDDTKNSCADYYEGCGFQTVYYGIGYINLDVEGIIFQETVSDQLVDNFSLV